MADDTPGDDRVAQMAAAILRFVQTYPDHYASRALIHVMALQADGGLVPADERMLALASVVQAIRDGGDPGRRA